MLVAKGTFAHISELDCALGAGVHEPIAAHGVKFSSSDDLSELLHVGRLDVHNVEALVLYVEVPQIYAEIVAADKCFAIAVDRYAVDVVGMGVGVGLPWHGRHDRVMMCQTWQLKITSILDDAR